VSITYGKPLEATFRVDGREVGGYVLLNRGSHQAGKAVLVSDTPFHVPVDSDMKDVQGMCRGRKMSLLYCHAGRCSLGSGVPPMDVISCELRFRYAMFGEHHLSRDDRKIEGMAFTFKHADTMLTNIGYDAFGQILRPSRECLDALKQEIETNELCHNRMPDDFCHDGSAIVKYYTGKSELFSDTPTVLGIIGATRRASWWDNVTPNNPFLTIGFKDDPVTLEEAFDKMRTVQQFFTWMTGFAPRWPGLTVYISADDSHGTFVYCPVEWDETQDDHNHARHRNMLIDPSRDPDKFLEVLVEWLRRNDCPKRSVANTAFFESMPGMFTRLTQQILRQAADALDMLPSEDKPELPPIPEPIRDILSAAHARIKDLGEHESNPVYSRVLNDLGRLNSYVNLRNTVEHRAGIILAHLEDDRMPRLKELGHMAVLCRNYFTHNNQKKVPSHVDFTNYHTVNLLAKTLQFIYGASELVKCGWDMNAWLPTSFAQFHTFGFYVKKNYHIAVNRVLR